MEGMREVRGGDEGRGIKGVESKEKWKAVGQKENEV